MAATGMDLSSHMEALRRRAQANQGLQPEESQEGEYEDEQQGEGSEGSQQSNGGEAVDGEEEMEQEKENSSYGGRTMRPTKARGRTTRSGNVYGCPTAGSAPAADTAADGDLAKEEEAPVDVLSKWKNRQQQQQQQQQHKKKNKKSPPPADSDRVTSPPGPSGGEGAPTAADQQQGDAALPPAPPVPKRPQGVTQQYRVNNSDDNGSGDTTSTTNTTTAPADDDEKTTTSATEHVAATSGTPPATTSTSTSPALSAGAGAEAAAAAAVAVYLRIRPPGVVDGDLDTVSNTRTYEVLKEEGEGGGGGGGGGGGALEEKKDKKKNVILAASPPTASIAGRTRGGAQKKEYTFSGVFQPGTRQEDVYDTAAKPLVEDMFRSGTNGLLFAYGMTNAGKTFTTLGDAANPGLLPRALRHIFERIADCNNSAADSTGDGAVGDTGPMRVEMSYLEIYNENVFDLLAKERGGAAAAGGGGDEANNNTSNMKPREPLKLQDRGGRIEPKSLSHHGIDSAEEGLQLVARGAKNRAMGSTHMNEGSSRSHCVCTVELKGGSVDGTVLWIVDLAGSERGSRTGAKGAQQKEANNINQSLTTLWRCMSMMRKNQQLSKSAKLNRSQVVPFRDSKLTYLFMNHLSGSSSGRTVMIVNINPSCDDFDETQYVLSNSAIAQEVKTVKDTAATSRYAQLTSSGYGNNGRKISSKLNAYTAHLNAKSGNSNSYRSNRSPFKKQQPSRGGALLNKGPMLGTSGRRRSSVHKGGPVVVGGGGGGGGGGGEGWLLSRPSVGKASRSRVSLGKASSSSAMLMLQAQQRERLRKAQERQERASLAMEEDEEVVEEEEEEVDESTSRGVGEGKAFGHGVKEEEWRREFEHSTAQTSNNNNNNNNNNSSSSGNSRPASASVDGGGEADQKEPVWFGLETERYATENDKLRQENAELLLRLESVKLQTKQEMAAEVAGTVGDLVAAFRLQTIRLEAMNKNKSEKAEEWARWLERAKETEGSTTALRGVEVDTTASTTTTTQAGSGVEVGRDFANLVKYTAALERLVERQGQDWAEREAAHRQELAELEAEFEGFHEENMLGLLAPPLSSSGVEGGGGGGGTVGDTAAPGASIIGQGEWVSKEESSRRQGTQRRLKRLANDVERSSREAGQWKREAAQARRDARSLRATVDQAEADAAAANAKVEAAEAVAAAATAKAAEAQAAAEAAAAAAAAAEAAAEASSPMLSAAPGQGSVGAESGREEEDGEQHEQEHDQEGSLRVLRSSSRASSLASSRMSGDENAPPAQPQPQQLVIQPQPQARPLAPPPVHPMTAGGAGGNGQAPPLPPKVFRQKHQQLDQAAPPLPPPPPLALRQGSVKRHLGRMESQGEIVEKAGGGGVARLGGGGAVAEARAALMASTTFGSTGSAGFVNNGGGVFYSNNGSSNVSVISSNSGGGGGGGNNYNYSMEGSGRGSGGSSSANGSHGRQQQQPYGHYPLSRSSSSTTYSYHNHPPSTARPSGSSGSGGGGGGGGGGAYYPQRGVLNRSQSTRSQGTYPADRRAQFTNATYGKYANTGNGRGSGGGRSRGSLEAGRSVVAISRPVRMSAGAGGPRSPRTSLQRRSVGSPGQSKAGWQSRKTAKSKSHDNMLGKLAKGLRKIVHIEGDHKDHRSKAKRPGYKRQGL